jgi:maltose alpha-D-glucosyltransferase/alpha-amylase
MAKKQLNDNLHWYKDAIIYELHIKAFNDSNGDGIGDFEGLIGKLDYLEKLGITAIWLLPFYPSPQRDDGYDIADYYTINPPYGDIIQFKTFLAEAHKRNLKVITELVINHTSDQHPWFQAARNAPKGSDERNYYVWSDNPEQYKDVRIIFQDFETSNWTWDPVAQQYYWHRFFHHQPDLNYDNPAVQQEVFNIINYWCDMGVDGFRLDAVPYLYEREGTNGENLNETHAFLKKLRRHVDDRYPGTLLLAEANMWPEDSASYFGNGDECQMNYHFPVMPRMFMALQMEDRYPVTDIYDQTPEIPDTCQWAIFLRNHDELTLEMVTDEERDYMYKMYVKDPKARINLGIRHRLAPLMENNRKKIELLNYLLFSLPGTPVIYYGDEIGMGDNFYLGDRNGVRTPMQWTSGRNAGFSNANPQQLYLPLITDPQYNYEGTNVEMQERDGSSLLWWMTRMINTRKKHNAFGRGDIRFIPVDNAKILAFTRTYKTETILVVVNLSRNAQPAEIDLETYKGMIPVEVFSKNEFPAIKDSTPYFFTLAAYDCAWFSLEASDKEQASPDTLSTLELHSWDDLLDKNTLEELETNILPDYLLKMRWFGGKARSIYSVRIISPSEIDTKGEVAYLMLLEVTYQSGLPELYQLPVALAKGGDADKVIESYPVAVIAKIDAGGEQGVLYDALYSKDYQHFIFDNIVANTGISLANGELVFDSSEEVLQYKKSNSEINAKILSAEQSNTSLVYDNAYFLKIYRKVDQSVNPDLEITQYLTEQTTFRNIPSYAGSMKWKHDQGTIVLAMLQNLIANNGDAWSYMLDRLDVFNENVLVIDKDAAELPALEGDFINPCAYENIPSTIGQLLDPVVAERVRQLGQRTGEMHIALSQNAEASEFKPENFSLHYQRSLYSTFQSAVRSAFAGQTNNLKRLSSELQQEMQQVIGMRTDILNAYKKIYSKKLDVIKCRIHGDYHLGQVLFTGKDFIILDFEGEPAKTYSERRLKRSPLRDVAGMIRSFHYAAYGSIFLNQRIQKEDVPKLIPYAEQWYHYMSGMFMEGYLETVKGQPFVPKDKDDQQTMIQTYLMEKAVYELSYELNNRPDWIIIPLRGIMSVMKNFKS